VPGFEPSSASAVDPAEFVSPDGVFLLARRVGQPAGCAGLRRFDAVTGEVKRVFVLAWHRRGGVGRALLERVEAEARGAGYKALRLDTTGAAPALNLFLKAGYGEIEPFNHNPHARHWLEKRLAEADSAR
jgi:GNAT superfamily N-acetyltransferase